VVLEQPWMFLLIQFVINFHHGKNVFKQKGSPKYCFTKSDIANSVVLEEPWTACSLVFADSVYNKLTSPKAMFFWSKGGYLYVVLVKAIWFIICLIVLDGLC
jgi:hypothetical protein